MVQGIPTNGGAHAQRALLLEHDSVKRREVKSQTGRVMQYAADTRILPINLDLSDNPYYTRDSAQLNSIWGMPNWPAKATDAAEITKVKGTLRVVLSMQLNLHSLFRRLRAVAIALLAPIAIMSSLMLSLQPAMAMVSHPSLTTNTFATMSNKSDAAAKDAEGKLESAYGDLTDDKGHQLKGKAKQVQASAMNVAEDVKQVARSAGKKIADATGQK